MAYTNAWDEAAPLGSISARLLDDKIRALKVDIRERFNSVIGATISDPLADPIVVAGHDFASLIAADIAIHASLDPLVAVQTFNIFIPGSLGTVFPFTNPTTGALLGTATLVAEATNGSGTMIVLPIWIPIGASITGFSFFHKENSALSSMNCFLEYGTAATGALTAIDNKSDVGTGAVVTSSKVLGAPHVVTTGRFYQARFQCSMNAAETAVLYGLQITYTSPTANTRI